MIDVIKRLEYLKINANKKWAISHDYADTMGALDEGIDALIKDLSDESISPQNETAQDFYERRATLVMGKNMTATEVLERFDRSVKELNAGPQEWLKKGEL